MNVKQAVPLFMVKNMQHALRFYSDGLGFKIQNTWEPRGTIEWCWLQLDAASLMLQQYRQSPSAVEHGVGVSINFICEDALIIYDQLVKKNIKTGEPFVGNNMWVVQIKDPDGYNIFFESPTDVPEETTYAEWIKK